MNATDQHFPAAIRDIWSAIKSEVIWLHARWIIYRQLYGISPERVDLLNRSASMLFYIFQMTLLNDVQLSLSKLSDPAGSGARRNMTLDMLLQLLKNAGETNIVEQLSSLVADYAISCERLRYRRNKTIAHFDLATMRSVKVAPLEGPSCEEIETALDALRKALNCVEFHYARSQTAYEEIIMEGDGNLLILNLWRGLRYAELVREGVIAHDDLRKKKQGI